MAQKARTTSILDQPLQEELALEEKLRWREFLASEDDHTTTTVIPVNNGLHIYHWDDLSKTCQRTFASFESILFPNQSQSITDAATG